MLIIGCRRRKLVDLLLLLAVSFCCSFLLLLLLVLFACLFSVNVKLSVLIILMIHSARHTIAVRVRGAWPLSVETRRRGAQRRGAATWRMAVKLNAVLFFAIFLILLVTAATAPALALLLLLLLLPLVVAVVVEVATEPVVVVNA